MKTYILLVSVIFILSGCFLNAQNLLKGDLDDFIKNDPDMSIDNYFRNIIDECRINEKLYGFPNGDRKSVV